MVVSRMLYYLLDNPLTCVLDMQITWFLSLSLSFFCQISVQNLTMKRLRGYEIKVMNHIDNHRLSCNYLLCLIIMPLICLHMIKYVYLYICICIVNKIPENLLEFEDFVYYIPIDIFWIIEYFQSVFCSVLVGYCLEMLETSQNYIL